MQKIDVDVKTDLKIQRKYSILRFQNFKSIMSFALSHMLMATIYSCYFTFSAVLFKLADKIDIFYDRSTLINEVSVFASHFPKQSELLVRNTKKKVKEMNLLNESIILNVFF